MEKLIIKQVSNVLTDEHVFVEFEGTEWTYRQVAEYLLLPEVKYCFVVDGHDVTDAELDDVCQQGAVLFVTINGPAWPAIWLAIKAVGAKIAAAYAAKGLFYYAVNAAVMTAISYGINAIFAPKPQKPNLPSNDDLTSSPSYGWNPTITQQEGAIVPKYYGTMVANSGNVITAYRDMDGVIPDVNTGAAREAIRCAVSYGFGPIKGIREVKINDQYLDENTGLVVQRRYGFTSQSRIAAIEDFTTTEDTPGYNVSTTCALYEHPIPAGTHAYEVVLHFPSGLYQYRDDGSKEGYPAQFEMYWYNVTTSTIIKPFITDSGATITKFARWSYGYYGPFGEDASGNWTLKGWREIEAWYEEDLPYDMANYSNSVEGFDCYWRKITVEEQLPDYQPTTYKTMTGPVYAATDVTFQFNLPYADGHSFKFYIRRIDAPDTLKQMASAYVSAIRYKTYRFTTYPRNVVLAISGIATERFNNDLDISAVIDGAIVNTYNGTSWTLQHSSNPAWIAWDVLTQPVYTNRSPIAENWGSWLGYDDILTLNRYDGFQPSQLNLNDFYAWAQFCDTLVSDGAGGTEKRFVANCVFDTDMSLWDAVTKFCENYRALIYWNGSEIRLCGDFGATSVSQRFNDGNIIADSLSISYIPKDTRANEVELSYLEEGNDNKRTVLALYDPEIEGGNKSQVTLFGTTRASEAWRIGKYLLACNKYINRIVKFSTSYEALHSALGDVIEIQHSMPDWAAGGRIASYNSATKIFYIDGLLLGDSEYLAMGFSQATIDGWRAGGAGQVINNQVDTGLTIGIRTLNGAYAEYAVYGGGWLNGQTQIILPVATSATGSPQLGDLYCLVGDVALQKFKITDISIENDNTVSITAVDYNEQIYVEADDCTGVTAPVLTLPDKFPNVTNITAATYAKLSAGAYTRALEVRWTIPISAYFAKVRVYLSYGSSATVLTNIAEFIGETTGTQYRLENAPVAEYYRVHVATVNTLGNEEPLSMCPSIGWEASDVNEVTIPYMATGVNELRVINSIGDGLTFNTPGCVIGWNAPEAAWADEKWLAYYEVNIYQTGTATVLHTAQVKGSREYTFAFDTNVACTGGPYRTFDIGVRAVDGLLNIGTEVKITAVNAQPMAVQNVTGNDFVGGATISWELLTAPDVAGYIVGYSANAGGPFMQLRQVGKDTASCEVYLEDGIWFFVVGGYDVFGTTGINYSTAISVAISHEISIANVVDFEEGLSDVYAVPIPRGVVWSVAANVLSWNAHEIIYSGTVYSIAAGSTSLASPYVYWQSLAGSYATTASLDTFNGLLPTSNQWQIAINYGAYYKLAWVAQANQVIGSAWIGEAAIQNVNIGNEIWSNNFSYTPGSSMSGWKISKSGKIMANDLEIYASDGTLLIDGNWENNWSSVIDDGGKPADNATVGATWGSDIANMPDNLTSYTENAVTKIYFPIGATHSNPNSSVAGAIKIVLPQGWTSTMLRFEVDVYTYSVGKSFKLLLAGYNYSGGNWNNTTVGLLGSVASDNRVRFAYDSALGKCCILIGSTTADGGASSWSCPKVAVSNFQAGYGSYYDKQYWETGWSISIVDSLANITSVVNWDDALVDAKSTTYVGGSLATTVESNAAEAKADADSALSQLTDMASDSKLTPVEKQAIKVEWDGIVAEKTLYDSQANAFRIIAEKASYGTAYTTLSDYITPLLSSLTTTSTIDGATFRANFASYYSARQTLLNKISSTSASVGPNICPNPDLKGDLTNNTTAPGWLTGTEGTPLSSLRYVTSDALAPPWDRQQPVFYSNSDSADDSTWWYSNLIPISETETYCLSVWARQQSATARVYLRLACYASDGATVTGYCHALAGYTGLSSTWTQYYDSFGPAGTLAIPANTRYCRIEWWGTYQQVGASMATRFCLNRGTIPNNAVVPSDLVGLSNPITEANHGTYIKYLTADTVVAGALRGINVNSSSHTCRGTYLTSGTASGNTTIYVHNTTDFGTSGSGYILDRLNDKDEFTWTGKTTTTLTGCSGVLDHNANATVIPKAPNIVLDKLSQELRIYGYNSTSNAYTACDQLVTLGIKDFGDGGSGTDTAIARFGNETFSRGLAAYFENNNPTVETVRIQNFQSSYNTNYSSLYVYGCDTATQIGGYGIYGVGKRAIVAYGYEYDFYASGPGTNGPFTGSHDALLPNTTLAAIGDIVCDTLVVYRRNISNTLTSVDISEAPKVKSVMGVLNNILSFYITAPLQYNSLSDFLYATTVANLPATMYEDIYTNVSIDNWEDYAAAFIHYVNNYSYIIVNALGEGQINVVAEGGNIEAGDYICSSSTPGKGMKQDDDLLHNYTVAKAREDVTWTEEEIANNVVKMIACTYHCG